MTSRHLAVTWMPLGLLTWEGMLVPEGQLPLLHCSFMCAHAAWTDISGAVEVRAFNLNAQEAKPGRSL